MHFELLAKPSSAHTQAMLLNADGGDDLEFTHTSGHSREFSKLLSKMLDDGLCHHVLQPEYWSYLGEGGDSIVYSFNAVPQYTFDETLDFPVISDSHVVSRVATCEEDVRNEQMTGDVDSKALSSKDNSLPRNYCSSKLCIPILCGKCLRIPKPRCENSDDHTFTASSTLPSLCQYLPRAVLPETTLVTIPISFIYSLARTQAGARDPARRAQWSPDPPSEQTDCIGDSLSQSVSEIDSAGSNTGGDVLHCELMLDQGVFYREPSFANHPIGEARERAKPGHSTASNPDPYFANTSVTFEFKPKWGIMRPSAAVCTTIALTASATSPASTASTSSTSPHATSTAFSASTANSQTSSPIRSQQTPHHNRPRSRPQRAATTPAAASTRSQSPARSWTSSTCATCPTISLAPLMASRSPSSTSLPDTENSPRVGDASPLDTAPPDSLPLHALLQVLCRNCAVAFHKQRPPRQFPPCSCCAAIPTDAYDKLHSSPCYTTQKPWCLRRPTPPLSPSANSAPLAPFTASLGAAAHALPVTPCPHCVFALPRALLRQLLGDIERGCDSAAGQCDNDRALRAVTGKCLFSALGSSAEEKSLVDARALAALVFEQFRALAVGPQGHLRVTHTTYAPPAPTTSTAEAANTEQRVSSSTSHTPAAVSDSLCSFFPLFAAAALAPPLVWTLLCLTLAQAVCDPFGPHVLPIEAALRHQTGDSMSERNSSYSNATAAGAEHRAEAYRELYLRSMTLKDLSVYVSCRVIHDAVVRLHSNHAAETIGPEVRGMYAVVEGCEVPLFIDYSKEIISRHSAVSGPVASCSNNSRAAVPDVKGESSLSDEERSDDVVDRYRNSLYVPLETAVEPTPSQLLEVTRTWASTQLTQNGMYGTIQYGAYRELLRTRSRTANGEEDCRLGSASLRIWRICVGDVGPKPLEKYEKATKQEIKITKAVCTALGLDLPK